MDLVRVYGQAERELKAELSTIDPLAFNAERAEKIRRMAQTIILSLNLAAKEWAEIDIPKAYTLASRRSRVALEILGKKPRRRPLSRLFGIQEDALEVLVKANVSIRRTVDEILEAALVGAHTARSIRVEEFDKRKTFEHFAEMGEEAVAAEISRGELGRKIMDYLKRRITDEGLIEIIDKNGVSRFWRANKYAKLVARTELRNAQTEATKELCRQYENDLVEISSHGTDCPICIPFEGNVYSISGHDLEYPPLTDDPPYHPNCVLPGNRLISPGGLIAGIRAQYDGKAVELTFAHSGQVSITKNHLFLTPRGFVPAHLLRKGDDVFNCPDFKRIVARHPDNNGYPTLVENVIRALTESPGMTAISMPVSSKDIHGDGRFCDGDIDIIRANGLLRNAREALFFKHGQALPFDPRNPDAPLFSSECDLATMFKALAFAADSIMGGRRLPSPLLWRQAGLCDSLGIPDGARFKAISNQGSADGCPSHSVQSGDVSIQQAASIETGSLSEIKPPALDGSPTHCRQSIPKLESCRNQAFAYRLRAYPKTLCKIARRQTAFVKTDKLIDIRYFFYHGPIYDFHSSTSLYILNGLVSSNCLHSVLPTSREAIKARGIFG